MKGNFIAKHMNTVNRGSAHKSLRDYDRSNKEDLEEGLEEHHYCLERKQDDEESAERT